MAPKDKITQVLNPQTATLLNELVPMVYSQLREMADWARRPNAAAGWRNCTRQRPRAGKAPQWNADRQNDISRSHRNRQRLAHILGAKYPGRTRTISPFCPFTRSVIGWNWPSVISGSGRYKTMY
jgi:hypothetical protein